VADYRKLGGLIRDARRQRRLTQNEIAEALGLSREQVSAIERGRPKKPLDPDHINTLADILSLPVLDMVIAQGYAVRVPVIKDEQQATLLHLFQVVPARYQRAVIRGLQEVVRGQDELDG